MQASVMAMLVYGNCFFMRIVLDYFKSRVAAGGWIDLLMTKDVMALAWIP